MIVFSFASYESSHFSLKKMNQNINKTMLVSPYKSARMCYIFSNGAAMFVYISAMIAAILNFKTKNCAIAEKAYLQIFKGVLDLWVFAPE